MNLCVRFLKAESPFLVVLWASWMLALLVFKGRCFGGSSLWCSFLGLGCLIWGFNPSSRRSSVFWISLPLVSHIRDQRLVRLHLYLSYPSLCDLSIFCCRKTVQPVFIPFLKKIVVHVDVILVYLWKEVSSGSSYTIILNLTS